MSTGAIALIVAAGLLGAPRLACAQLLAAKDGPVVYGHHHLHVTSVDQHRRFWVDGLGGALTTLGTTEIVKFPNVLIFMTETPPTGGTKATTVNHVGFQVRNLRAALDRLRNLGYPIVTKTESSSPATDDMVFIAVAKTYVAFVMGPDDTKVELFENPTMAGSIAMHHVHFATSQVAEMQGWYVKVFGTKVGNREHLDPEDLPGVNLSYTRTAEPVVGTKGRVLDHIGFEIDNLEAFCRRLEAMGITFDRPYVKNAALNIGFAFLSDPWGTSIELTEGLDAVR